MDQTSTIVMMVPFPAQGHLNQLLHFSRIVAGRGFPVHYLGSATHNRQAKQRVHGWDPNSTTNIHFHDLPIPHFATPAPNPHALIKFPAHLQPTFDATLHLRDPFTALLGSLSSTARRVAVVHDPLMSFAAQESTAHPNVEAFGFHSISAFASFFHYMEVVDQHIRSEFIIPNLQPLSLKGCFTEEFVEFIARNLEMMESDVGHLYNTCRPIEGEFIDLLNQPPLIGKMKLWSVGPLNPVVLEDTIESRPQHECLKWLDKQPPKSVLYVSFGTMSSIPNEQIYEIAIGLERSNQRFIWVLRDADVGDIFAIEDTKKSQQQQLPQNYEERIKGVGLIMRDWAPQLEILAHPSTGGFLSHCGWNSCIESMSMGVPIAAWPMHSDQPRNTMLLTEVLRIGVAVRDWAHREEIVSSKAVDSVVRKLMASDQGEEMRRRAEELGVAVRGDLEEGGSSRVDLDSFLSYISRS